MVWWNPQQWAEVVERTPLVSIDLIVTNARNEVLLGWRNNKPAQHCWFVPGGVVRKGEKLQQAFERVLLDELGAQANLDRTKLFAGVYEHHYTDNFAGLPGVATHYVVLAHRLNAEQHLPGLGGLNGLPQIQHNKYEWMPVAELLSNPQVHEHTKVYFSG
ncbi:MAG: GDP-mannose mannosyl hydrolase [Betaproteobacteria bacterium]|nr:MAG: GDP-mannose mannosyl hydrolase [Betaproteobacteria bacterium]PZO25202.1 MAG: GDP-mannose mannosyl hydrolase [Betaproteobacteria bacterium]PZO29667.1 MAG: GDP-mannose mannosyl hydrolase [Betaproteobacteria bacterium]